ncbi:MAG: tetratricopeptide repeat protein [Bacteroidales bacterium]|nr:tetratricopeptide repeat protein [Bacteroidales bacterium]MDY4941921.1 tetratricopeptide repeat protein [Candidatus Limisoma sp.]
MKRLIFIIAALGILFTTYASESLADKAFKSYSQDQYSEAVDIYNEILAGGEVSSDLYYNLGNAYYKSGFPAKAILCYERALLLDPNNAEARNNLNFANSKLVDTTSNDEDILDSFGAKLSNLTTFNGWAVIAIISFLLILGAAALYIFNSNVLLRKVGFFGGIVMIVVCIVSNIIAVRTASVITDSGYAILMSESATFSTSPREAQNKSEEAFTLHSGVKLQIVDSLLVKTDKGETMWYNVKTDDAHQAWIAGTEIEKI